MASNDLSLQIPPALIELVAERAAEIVRAEAPRVESYLTAREAAEYLACPLSRIYALASAGRIPHYRDGTRLLFRASELDAWLEAGGGRRP